MKKPPKPFHWNAILANAYYHGVKLAKKGSWNYRIKMATKPTAKEEKVVVE